MVVSSFKAVFLSGLEEEYLYKLCITISDRKFDLKELIVFFGNRPKENKQITFLVTIIAIILALGKCAIDALTKEAVSVFG